MVYKPLRPSQLPTRIRGARAILAVLNTLAGAFRVLGRLPAAGYVSQSTERGSTERPDNA